MSNLSICIDLCCLITMHHLVSSNVIWHNFTCLGCYSAMWDNCNIIWQHIKLWELQRQFSLFSLTWYGSHNLLEKSTDKYDIYAATVHMVAKFSKCLHRFGILWNRGSTKRSQKQSMDTQCQWAKLEQSSSKYTRFCPSSIHTLSRILNSCSARRSLVQLSKDLYR